MSAHPKSRAANRRAKLVGIPGGKGHRAASEPSPRRARSGVEELFSTRVREKKPKKGRKKELPPAELPREMARICDLYAAGKTVLREIDYKIDFASQRLREFALRGFVHLFVSSRKKPPSLDYVGDHSRLKFVQTRRTTLSAEKADDLRSMGIPVDEYTELVGIDVRMEELRRHGLADRLREGLEGMGVRKSVLDECFEPRHELSPAFFDNLYSIVRDSLGKDEDLERKMLEVMTTLNPAEQLRNVEIKDLDVKECFELILRTEVEADESEAA